MKKKSRLNAKLIIELTYVLLTFVAAIVVPAYLDAPAWVRFFFSFAIMASVLVQLQVIFMSHAIDRLYEMLGYLFDMTREVVTSLIDTLEKKPSAQKQVANSKKNVN